LGEQFEEHCGNSWIKQPQPIKSSIAAAVNAGFMTALAKGEGTDAWHQTRFPHLFGGAKVLPVY
jgi:hypothetical protein